MCDVNKIKEAVDELMNMDSISFRQLMIDAENEEQRQFYIAMHDYLMQKRQAEVIKSGVF